jgi:hypothetical protein
MPIGPIKTKKQKGAVVHHEMEKYSEGKLHSGSKKGPVVTNPKQAVAIAMSESGQSRGKGSHSHSARQPHPATNPGEFDTEPHDRGAPTPAMPERSDARPPCGPPHVFRGANHHAASGYGHEHREGSLRLSGAPGAHRIGKR